MGSGNRQEFRPAPVSNHQSCGVEQSYRENDTSTQVRPRSFRWCGIYLVQTRSEKLKQHSEQRDRTYKRSGTLAGAKLPRQDFPHTGIAGVFSSDKENTTKYTTSASMFAECIFKHLDDAQLAELLSRLELGQSALVFLALAEFTEFRVSATNHQAGWFLSSSTSRS